MTRPTLSVIGLGYIGLPTAIAFARQEWQVTGIDVNPDVVAEINAGVIPFEEPGMEEALKEVLDSDRFHAQVEQVPADVHIIAVPTPFYADKTADLSYIRSAAEAIGPLVRQGDLVVLESTSPPGTTEKMAAWVQGASPTGAEGVLFAHAPERVLPGRILEELTTNDRIVGGLTPEATRLAKQIYETFSEGDVLATDSRTAEMSKLAENSFRDVNIAFANELSVICDQLGVDVWELISLANRHPRVNILQPGPGVGGHCIAVDPWFIVESSPESSNLIRTARQVNDAKPQWVINKIKDALEEVGGDNVSLFGLAFKPDVDDLRESPSVAVVAELARQLPNATLKVVEPYVQDLPEELSTQPNVELVAQDEALVSGDVLVMLVDHRDFQDVDPELLRAKKIVDTRGRWVSAVA